MPKVHVVSIEPSNNRLAVTLSDGKEVVRCENVMTWPAAKVSEGALESLFNYWKMRAAVATLGCEMFLQSDMQPQLSAQ